MKATQRLTVFFISISEGVRIDPQSIISDCIRPYLYFFLCILFFFLLFPIFFFFSSSSSFSFLISYLEEKMYFFLLFLFSTCF